MKISFYRKWKTITLIMLMLKNSLIRPVDIYDSACLYASINIQIVFKFKKIVSSL